MKRISVEAIDVIAEEINSFSPEQVEELIDEMGEEQPSALGYIMSKDFELMGENEHELLIFNALMLWSIIKKEIGITSEPDEEDIDDIQDENWKAVEELPTLKGQKFDDYVEPMIAEYAEDELLYFVLDTFQEDEGDEFSINKESKLPIFVALKSLCDAWLEEGEVA